MGDGSTLIFLLITMEKYKQKQPKVIVTKSIKNIGLAIFLAIIFPYFGVLYATVSEFFWLAFSLISMVFFFIYAGELIWALLLIIPHFLISIIWAGIATSNYNKKIINEAEHNS